MPIPKTIIRAKPESGPARWARLAAQALADLIYTPGSAPAQQTEEGFQTVLGALSPVDLETGLPNIDKGINAVVSPAIKTARRAKIERYLRSNPKPSNTRHLYETVPADTRDPLDIEFDIYDPTNISERSKMTPDALRYWLQQSEQGLNTHGVFEDGFPLIVKSVGPKVSSVDPTQPKIHHKINSKGELDRTVDSVTKYLQSLRYLNRRP